VGSPVRNKPNLPYADRRNNGRTTAAGAGDKRAKRTQFGRSGPRRAKCAKRTQSGGQIVRNKPNLGRGGRREPPIFRYFHHSTIPVRCRLCETNPDLGRQGNLGDGGSGRAILRNKANSVTDRRGRRGVNRAKQSQFPWQPGRGTQSRQTKPIPARVAKAGAGTAMGAAAGTVPSEKSGFTVTS
jgi:hypothetical protein